MDDSKKNIAVLINSMGGGGAERVVSLFLNKMILDYSITLFVIFPVFSYSIPDEVQVVSLLKNKPKNGFLFLLLMPLIFYRYLKLLNREVFDVSISFLLQSNLINSLYKVFNKHCKVILSERNYPSIMYSSSSLRLFLSKVLIKHLYSKADVVFSNSQMINEDLIENFGVRGPQFEVVYNPIIIPKEIKKIFCKSNQLRFVSVGRFIALKNHKMIFDSLSLIKLKSKSTLTIYGKGDLLSDYINYIKKKEIGDFVYFPGFSKNIINELLNFDVFILSSYSEGFPNALLEAMSLGLPVISTNCKSGPLELLNDNIPISIKKGEFYVAKYGLLINVGDYNGLAKAMLYLYNTPDMLKYLSLKSRNRANDFDLNLIYGKLTMLIDN